MTEVTDPRGNVTRYSYDQLDRLTTRDEPGSTNDERARWKYTYTRTGEVLSVTDPTGVRTETTYDDLDRPVTATQVERTAGRRQLHHHAHLRRRRQPDRVGLAQRGEDTS